MRAAREADACGARAQLDSGSFSHAGEGGAAAAAGRGKPVRVHAHRKLVKELTDLLLTQELAAHDGAPYPSPTLDNPSWIFACRPCRAPLLL